MHGGAITAGCQQVLIGGSPAARQGDMHSCPKSSGMTPHIGGPIASGSGSVMIGGQPAARVGDTAVCAAGGMDSIAAGEATVLIG